MSENHHDYVLENDKTIVKVSLKESTQTLWVSTEKSELAIGNEVTIRTKLEDQQFVLEIHKGVMELFNGSFHELRFQLDVAKAFLLARPFVSLNNFSRVEASLEMEEARMHLEYLLNEYP